MNIAPMVSACAYMYGQHDYNKIPMAPMGCAALINLKPDIRKTWDSNAINGYYLGTLQECYKCYKVWVKQTHMSDGHSSFQTPIHHNADIHIS